LPSAQEEKVKRNGRVRNCGPDGNKGGVALRPACPIVFRVRATGVIGARSAPSRLDGGDGGSRNARLLW